MSAPEVQPAGQEGRADRWTVTAELALTYRSLSPESKDLVYGLMALADEEQAELRVVVEGLRTQLATWEATAEERWHEIQRLGSQVAAVKALAEKPDDHVTDTYECGAIDGYNIALRDVRAALESRLG
jgi:hypothetical protein